MANSTEMNVSDRLCLHCKQHQKDVSALCRTHKQCLCITCLIERKHSDKECDIEDINELSDDNSKLLVQLLSLSNQVQTTENECDKFGKTICDKKDALVKDISGFYDKLETMLQSLRDKTLKSLDDQAKQCEQIFVGKREELKQVKDYVTKQLNDFTDSSKPDTSNSLERLVSIMKQIDEIESIESVFVPETELLKALVNSRMLGNVSLFLQLHYEDVNTCNPKQDLYQSSDQVNYGSVNEEINAPKDGETSTDLKQGVSDKTRPPVPVKKPNLQKNRTDSSSQSISEVSPTQSVKHKESARLNNPQRKSDEVCNESTVSDVKSKDCLQPTLEAKSDATPNAPVKKLEKHNRTQSCASSKSAQHDFQIKSLKNQKIQLSKLPDRTSVFTSINMVESNTLVLGDVTHGLVLFVDLSGKVLCSKTVKGTIHAVTPFRSQRVAILRSKGNLVKLTIISKNKKINHMLQDDTLDAMKDQVTGFDFDPESNRLAVSGSGNVLVLDVENTPTVFDKYTYGENNTHDGTLEKEIIHIKTTYDFITKRIYVLKQERQSLKCYRVNETEHVWSKRCSDAEFIPRQLCQTDDTLVVLCKEQICLFSKKDGSAVSSAISTADKLHDACGLFVVCDDDIAIISSKSETKSLAFIAF